MLQTRLKAESAILAKGFDAVCCFVNDRINEEVVQTLIEGGVKFIAMRCAGFDKVGDVWVVNLVSLHIGGGWVLGRGTL